MATQNPIEQEGTYPLPEAQIDRFMLHVMVDYPDRATHPQDHGARAQRGDCAARAAAARDRLTQEHGVRGAPRALGLTLSDPVAEYIAALVDATRRPEPYSAQLAEWLRWGVSPRAAIAIERGARAMAWLGAAIS